MDKAFKFAGDNMYKLIVSDLDGTYLNDEKIAPKENIEMANHLMDLGYDLIFATGRKFDHAVGYTKDLNKDTVIIANNGNLVRHTDSGKVESTTFLDMEHLKLVLELGKQLDLHPVVHVHDYKGKYTMIGELDRFDKRYFKYVENEETFIQVKDLLKEDLKILSIVYLGDYKKLEKLKDSVMSFGDENYKSYLMSNITIADSLLEIVNPIGSKWRAASEYAFSKGIKIEEIIAIGDDINDSEMVKKAGLGIAMKNAVKLTKDSADIIGNYDNNSAGFAKVLKEVLDVRI